MPLEPGEAVVTRFSHTTADGGSTIIDVSGTSASIIDVRRPPDPPSGQHWIDEPQRMPVTAGEVGQVFGVALGLREDASPDIYLSATAAFGLHRDAGGEGWMDGMWGPDAGPGTIYKISIDNGYTAEKFADVTLDGRQNTGASLGNIAFDRWNNRLLVSDLETGMIHVLDAETGEDLGHFDHGVDGRTSFTDAWTGAAQSLDPVAFDPTSTSKLGSCASDFNSTPDCWNIADFRRRIWGINVRQEDGGGIRVYYAVWGSDAFGNADWAGAGDDRRNAVWSVALGEGGSFDTKSVRREFFMPAFWPATPAMGDKAGNSNPVSDIAFPDCGPLTVMAVSERGGMRNLGLDKDEAFARPYESRVLRYELGNDGIWRPVGRYDVGFHDRSAAGESEPFIFANAAGGAAFGYGFGESGEADPALASQSLWMTGDGLCSPKGACMDMTTGSHDDTNEVHGMQGSPADGFVPVDASGDLAKPASTAPDDFGVLDLSYMIDTDINVDESGAPIADELKRNDATKIGDVAIYQQCRAAPPLPAVDIPEEAGAPPVLPPPDWPVHTLKRSHDKWASTAHSVKRSWHRRDGSWHLTDRSWHWKSNSWHLRSKTWHWREGSWHSKERSWHQKGQSLHNKTFSWHFRDKSWHLKSRTYHDKVRSWDNGHVKNKSYHVKGRTWNDDQPKHVKNKTYHVKSRTWGDDQPKHVKNKTFHVKSRTWGDNDQPKHVKNKTFHVKSRTWGDNDQPKHVKGKTFHTKGKSYGDGTPDEPKHVKGKTFHKRGKSFGGGDATEPKHVKGKSTHVKGRTWNDGGTTPTHTKKKSKATSGGSDNGTPPVHTKKKSKATSGGSDNGTPPVHTKKKSKATSGGSDNGTPPVHTKKKSKATSGDSGSGTTEPKHTKKRSNAASGGDSGSGTTEPKHTKKRSNAASGGDSGTSDAGTTRTKRKKMVHVKETSEFISQ